VNKTLATGLAHVNGLMVQNSTVETAVRRYGSKDVRWSSQGMLRLTPEAMQKLFQPTMDQIKDAIANVISQPAVKGTTPYLKLEKKLRFDSGLHKRESLYVSVA